MTETVLDDALSAAFGTEPPCPAERWVLPGPMARVLIARGALQPTFGERAAARPASAST